MKFWKLFLILAFVTSGNLLLKADEVVQAPSKNPILVLSKVLHAQFVKRAGLGTMSTVPSANDEALRTELKKIFFQIYKKRNDNYHSFSIYTQSKIPIEIAGLSVKGPNASPMTEADRLNGIDSRVSYSITASAYRTHTRKIGWSEWKPGNPLLMTGFSFERKNGKWAVTNSPLKFYSAH